MMELVGYLASLLIGVSLGLIGGGGSILTVPVMVYLFGMQPLPATSYSLFIVGTTSLVGAWSNLRKGMVNYRAVLFFGATSIATVFATRKFIILAIPHTLTNVGPYALTSSFATMVLFALLMLLASISMIRNNGQLQEEKECKDCLRIAKLLVYGIGIGLITGLLGAGGGFLLIPALVLLIKLPMKKAVGTSLFIIALNSLVGFAGDLGHFTIDWLFLLKITTIAVAGIFMGGAVGKRFTGKKLKKSFGWFVLVMGIYIIVKETMLK